MTKRRFQFGTRKQMVFVALAGVVIFCGITIRSMFVPHDLARVRFTFENPESLDFAYVLVNENDPKRLNTYHRKVIYSSMRGPIKFPFGSVQDFQWVHANKYGILAIDENKMWRLWWLSDEDIDIGYAIPGLRSRHVTIRVPPLADAKSPPRSLIESLDLTEVWMIGPNGPYLGQGGFLHEE